MPMSKYRIDKSLLHVAKTSKKILESIHTSTYNITEPYSGSFFHYTSPEGLQGILKNRHLFFTDCQFLNDRVERLHINTELKYFWATQNSNYLKEFSTLLSNIQISGYEDSAYGTIEKSDIIEDCRYFVFSTSTKKDSLAMWRYYSKNGNCDGYCITLNTYALIDEWIDRDTGVAIEHGHVIYESSDKQAKILNQVEYLYDIWSRYEHSDGLNKIIIKSYSSWASYASLFFKHDRFSEEKEYRLVAIAPAKAISSLSYTYKNQENKIYDFRISQGVLIPYIKIPFCTWNKDECYAISEILVGPSPNDDLKVAGIEYFIKSLDYDFPELRITKSIVPLRF